ncbi:S8 family serine peptidase [Auraticoccus sp. F435]|uniref:S8 family serine peptidase n=1 Tax=Auraticoccus cholistanensis TaxID=2656650 RepID=A0A6A9UPF0_9ACTN|nr:S8 family serine peptidase [Auraticoccus cholistanensis]
MTPAPAPAPQRAPSLRRLLRSTLRLGLGATLLLGLSPVAGHAEEDAERYLVQTESAPVAEQLAERTDGEVGPVARFSPGASKAFTAELTGTEAARLRSHPQVTDVVRDVRIRLAPTTVSTSATSTVPWGLDRIDQRSRTGNGRYTTPTTGEGTVVVVVDTGINDSHDQFSGRVLDGYDYFDYDETPQDCNGHGTHVAGTAAGRTLGAAPGAWILPLRVFDCRGDGYLSDVLYAFEDVLAWQVHERVVVNFSGGAYVSELPAEGREIIEDLEDVIGSLYNQGVPVVTAAGNEGVSGCSSSPGRLGGVINVAATDSSDRRPAWSDRGGCVDLFAPGVGIRSAWISSRTSTQVLDGTSMAAPHVTGVVARFLERQPRASVKQVWAAIRSDATLDVVRDPAGTPNRLVYSDVDFRKPGVPTSTRADLDHAARSTTVRWAPPVRDGGRPITGYRVTRSDEDASGRGPVTKVVSAGSRSSTFTDLVPGHRYTFSVTAINAVGTGPKRAWLEAAVVQKPGRPARPVLKSGYTDDRSVSVRADWDRPSGGAVDHYVITARPTSGGSTTTRRVDGDVTWGSVPGLVRGRSYIVSVYGVNAAGAGAKSPASAAATAR